MLQPPRSSASALRMSTSRSSSVRSRSAARAAASACCRSTASSAARSSTCLRSAGSTPGSSRSRAFSAATAASSQGPRSPTAAPCARPRSRVASWSASVDPPGRFPHPLQPLELDPPPAGAAQHAGQEHGGGQGGGQPPRPPLGGRLGLGLLRAGALGGPGQLGLAQPLLHAGQVGGHALGDHSRIGRPVLGIGGQAVAGQGQELAVGPAALQPGQRRGRVRPPRRSKDLDRPSRQRTPAPR